jgi:hypothetical protein
MSTTWDTWKPVLAHVVYILLFGGLVFAGTRIRTKPALRNFVIGLGAQPCLWLLAFPETSFRSPSNALQEFWGYLIVYLAPVASVIGYAVRAKSTGRLWKTFSLALGLTLGWVVGMVALVALGIVDLNIRF